VAVYWHPDWPTYEEDPVTHNQIRSEVGLPRIPTPRPKTPDDLGPLPIYVDLGDSPSRENQPPAPPPPPQEGPAPKKARTVEKLPPLPKARTVEVEKLPPLPKARTVEKPPPLPKTRTVEVEKLPPLPKARIPRRVHIQSTKKPLLPLPISFLSLPTVISETISTTTVWSNFSDPTPATKPKLSKTEKRKERKRRAQNKN
jgi:hypothetical protein